MGDYVYAFGSFWCFVGDGFGDGVEPDADGLRGWRYQQHADPALFTKPDADANADTHAHTHAHAYAHTDAYTDAHSNAYTDDCDWKADHQRQFHCCCQCF
jgi:hypothetical protein